MNGPSAAELLEVLRAVDAAAEAGCPALLATVVTLDGSVYARAGAVAVVAGQDGLRGTVPLSELTGGLREACEAALSQAAPFLADVELPEDDPALGYGLGSPGRVELFFERVTPALGASLRPLREAVLRGEGVVCALCVEGAKSGERKALAPGSGDEARECYEAGGPELIESARGGKVVRTLYSPVKPMGKALIFGSGPTALALCRQLADLGMAVSAADPRPGRLRQSWWRHERVALIEGGWEQARAAASPDEDTVVVVMTRSYALDLETLQGALQSPARYVGLTGPRRRAERMLAELEALGVKPRPGQFFAPAGLEVGAQSLPERALSIAAEILSSRERPAARRPERLGPLPAQAKVPGLVLAAGRGRRFGGQNKLTAPLYGKPVLRHAVENALASKLDPVIVVLGCDAAEALRTLEGLEDPKLRVVFNPRWKGGKASSIECGLRECPAFAPGVVSLMGDMPLVKPWLIDRVLEEFELTGKLTFPVYRDAKCQPTAFPRALFSEIKALTGDDTAMEAVRRHWLEAVRIPLPDASTQADVDTAEDLELLLQAPEAPRESHRI